MTRTFLSRSLSETPKRCSSSTITSPRSPKRTSFCRSRAVPMTMSTFPAFSSSKVFFCSPFVWKRVMMAILTGKPAMRWVKVRKCWSASTVVGASTAHCLTPITHLKAARMATSVLPKPTSPTTRRSMGRGDIMSSRVSAVARPWSSVGSYGNEAANSRSISDSGGKMCPG
ncbi:MAG: hypothetical protein A2506_05365 [Elusimicrobia bacterium RIFOXYD12_FULL_66_9]|nr:MAG: hypothetical protein A2506_05365 [Elusimicrobia bacterium RIFOXYD12_FULL_66_9]